jgi:2-polyprenyl-3-methyl-5-hydroxy-6-metoxy-1,4-benzoquinol methylase
MSYYSEIEYKKKDSSSLWFEELYYHRWFDDVKGRILDVGCATGNFIALDPERIEGVDIDDDSLEIARARGFNVRKLDAEKGMSEIADQSYGGIYAKHVVEHLHDPFTFVEHLRRVLAPGGLAVISTPNCPYVLDKHFWDDYTHIHPFTANSLRMIAYDAGFKDVTIYQDFRCFPGLGRIMRTFGLTPTFIRTIQACFGIRGLSLIVELRV